MNSALEHVLLGDIGATNARLALLSNGVLGTVRNFSVADFPCFVDVIRTFLSDTRGSVSEHQAVLAVAGPVTQGRCVLTNCSWTIDPHDLRQEFDFARIDLCNDFEAVALSVTASEGS
jgi:glucokinase